MKALSLIGALAGLFSVNPINPAMRKPVRKGSCIPGPKGVPGAKHDRIMREHRLGIKK